VKKHLCFFCFFVRRPQCRRFLSLTEGLTVGSLPASWPIQVKTVTPEPKIVSVTQASGSAKLNNASLYDVVVSLAVSDEHVVVKAVEVPWIFASFVEQNLEGVMPFLAAALNQPDPDPVRIEAAVEQMKQLNALLPSSAQVDLHHTDILASDAASQKEARVEVRADLFSCFPGLQDLGLKTMVASCYGKDAAEVYEVVSNLSFEIRVIKQADHYGDTASAEVTAHYQGRTASFEVTGGVAQSWPKRALNEFFNLASHSDPDVVNLVGPETTGLLAACPFEI
jgi:hypothetical protein